MDAPAISFLGSDFFRLSKKTRLVTWQQRVVLTMTVFMGLPISIATAVGVAYSLAFLIALLGMKGKVGGMLLVALILPAFLAPFVVIYPLLMSLVVKRYPISFAQVESYWRRYFKEQSKKCKPPFLLPAKY